MRKFLTSILEKLTEKVKKKDYKEPILEKDRDKNKSLPKAKKGHNPKKRKQKDRKNIYSDNLPQEILHSISPQKMKLISVAGDIRLDPDKTESAFMARQLVQATLPHKNPGNVQIWSRTNGTLTLSIQPGMDTKKKKSIGYNSKSNHLNSIRKILKIN